MAEENEINSATQREENEKQDDSSNGNDVELIDLADEADDESKDFPDKIENGENCEDDADDEEDDVDDEEEVEEAVNGNSNGVEKVNSDDEIMICDDEDEGSESLDNIDETSELKSENSILNNVNNKKAEEKEEIIIDDDDEDEVQDLSTKTPIEELIPKLSNEEIGFPSYFTDVITLGECIAISKKSRSDIDIDKDYSILDCPSQVVPLIIKRSNKFPAKLKQEKDEASKQINPPSAPNQNTKNMLTISDFYASSIGKFLIGIGLSRVKQWYHKDAINKVRKQIRKEGEAEDLMEELKKQQDYLNACRAANASYLFPSEKCEHCEYRTEFKLVLNHHMAFPHMTSRKEFKCNYCQYSTRDQKVITDHVQYMHEKKCLIELPPQLYECPICPYESGVKSKAATHIAKCLKFFVPEKLLVNKDEYFPTITPKPITQEDIKIYEATLQALRFAALNPQTKVPQIPGLPPGLQQQMYMVQQQQLTRPGPGRPVKTQSKARQLSPYLMNNVNLKNISTPQLYQMLSNSSAQQLLQNSAAAAANFSNLPSNAINFMNKQQQHMLAKYNQANQVRNSPTIAHNNVSNNRASLLNSRPTNNIANRADGNSAVQRNGSFVMCEICDGYIKDLEQLRTHMHWIHKVKIHPKMLASRPPLNCQKCQWRFFTDQGLERHLLGAHGLVTSNMQDLVNQNQDGGRCTICGRVFNSKLVTHMNQAHKISLKPAHLSYKCTVCSATFNLYRLFENHVYMVHSGSVKRNAQDDNGQPPRKRVAVDGMVANGN